MRADYLFNSNMPLKEKSKKEVSFQNKSYIFRLQNKYYHRRLIKYNSKRYKNLKRVCHHCNIYDIYDISNKLIPFKILNNWEELIGDSRYGNNVFEE